LMEAKRECGKATGIFAGGVDSGGTDFYFWGLSVDDGVVAVWVAVAAESAGI
jgi:hypothetical protein